MDYKRIDLHMHSLFSDGELLPSELTRRALVLNHEAIAITDHIDYSNIEEINELQGAIDDLNENWDIEVILGAEITHVPSSSIKPLAKRARAKIALKNDVALEISCRAGHCLGNGHVAKIAQEVGNNLVIDTDTHAPGDLRDFDSAYKIGLGAGLTHDEAIKALTANPKHILEKRL